MTSAIDVLRMMPAIEDVRHTIAPHAPYSVSPALFGRIRAALKQDPFARTTVHLGESEAEVEFLREGTGAYRSMLEDIGKWDPSWVAPGCGPVEYIDRMGFLDDRLLVVHGVQFGAGDLERIAQKGATLVTCPRGNIATRAGRPPISEFFESGVPSRGRHRQPCKRSRPESVCRARRDAAPLARNTGACVARSRHDRRCACTRLRIRVRHRRFGESAMPSLP